MADYNNIVIVGRLTHDPELRHIPSGKAVCGLRVATKQGWGDREGTCFIDVTVWDKSGEACDKYLRKGSSLLVAGELQLDQWEDNEGNKRSKHKINAREVKFLDGKDSARGGDGGEGNSGGNPRADRQREIDELAGDDGAPF